MLRDTEDTGAVETLTGDSVFVVLNLTTGQRHELRTLEVLMTTLDLAHGTSTFTGEEGDNMTQDDIRHWAAGNGPETVYIFADAGLVPAATYKVITH